MMITGCWANINPPSAYHPTHNHPNNYLSGVYYVAVPETGTHLIFQDPRPVLDHALDRQDRPLSPPTPALSNLNRAAW